MEVVTRMATRQQADVMASAAAGDEIAEEATQAAWVIAWKRLRDVSGPSHLRPWLVRVAANEAKQLLRKRRTRAKFEVVTVASQQPGVRDPATGVTGLDLREAISRLDADDRALIAMRYVAGFDSNELALATGKSPAAVRQRLKRLLDRLREDLTDG
jgi:RNA polymerase sigma-70 factor (ECF subfamily)